MKPIYWYIALAVIGTGFLILTLVKRENKIELMAFFLCTIAFSFLGEYFILGVFEGYAYKPGILQDPIADSLAGHLICNMSLYGGLAVAVAALTPRYYWVLVIAVSFMAIEYLFLQLGIFQQEWWEIYMTGIAAVIYFSLVKMWYNLLIKGKNRFVRNFMLFTFSLAVIHFLSAMLLPVQKQYFSPGFFDNVYKDSSMFAFPFNMTVALGATIMICKLKKWYFKPLPIIFCILVHFLFNRLGILNFYRGWNLLYLSIVQSVGLGIVIVTNHMIFKPDPDFSA